MVFAVYGGAQQNVPKKYLDAVFHLGEVMADYGCGLIYGGGDTGCMGAVAHGVLSNGGHVTSVIPHGMSEFEAVLTERDNVSVIWTDTMAERKSVMENNCDAFIIAPGGVGTMDEFFQAVTLRDLREEVKPIILLNVDGYYDHVIRILDKFASEGFTRPGVAEMISIAQNGEEAVSMILRDLLELEKAKKKQ